MSENENTPLDYTRDGYAAVESAQDSMDMFLSAADVRAAYAEPVEHGEHMIIPAAEIISIAGFGFGSGGSNEPNDSGGGGGGGGGGRVLTRPVAVVVASPDGVRVEPVLDITKVALAALTAFGFMITMVGRMKSGKINED